jgi:hypothetical protein
LAISLRNLAAHEGTEQVLVPPVRACDEIQREIAELDLDDAPPRSGGAACEWSTAGPRNLGDGKVYLHV